MKSFYLPEVLFIKTELVYLHFLVCHVMSRLITPSFSLANSLISADVLSAARERYKTLLVKLILVYIESKIDLKLKTFFCEKNRLQNTKNDNKKIRFDDLNLGTVGNRKHAYFLFGLISYVVRSPNGTQNT